MLTRLDLLEGALTAAQSGQMPVTHFGNVADHTAPSAADLAYDPFGVSSPRPSGPPPAPVSDTSDAFFSFAEPPQLQSGSDDDNWDWMQFGDTDTQRGAPGAALPRFTDQAAEPASQVGCPCVTACHSVSANIEYLGQALHYR